MKFYRLHSGIIVRLDAINAIEPDEDWSDSKGPRLAGYYIRVAHAQQYSVSLTDGQAIIELLEKEGGLV